jgi:hypothetical protein
MAPGSQLETIKHSYGVLRTIGATALVGFKELSLLREKRRVWIS